MKVIELIRQLKQCDPDARVYAGNENGNKLDEVFSLTNTGMEVILRNGMQTDSGEEIKAMIEDFTENNVDEDYGYQHMVDCGFTPDIVAEYYNPGIADVMQKYCEEHGIEAR